MNDPQEQRSLLFDSILLYFKAFVLSAKLEIFDRL